MRVLNIIKNSFIEFNQNAVRIADKTNKNRFVILLDMCYCAFKYSASPNNYEKFEFYNLNKDKRSTYVTYGLSQKMIKNFNCQSDIDIFENKLKFAEEFSDFYKRDYLSVSDMTYDEFQKFCRNKEKFICKPYGGSQGADIKVFYTSGNLEEIYNTIKNTCPVGFMLDEWIPQHDVLQRIYPKAVNCLRIITVYDGENTHLITGGVTFGISTEIANGSQPSIVAPVDFETGIMHKPAATFGSELYDIHPTTGEQIVGVALPFWREINDMLDEACKRVPTVGYIGWDIAITPTGPVIIEGNTTPGYKYYQIPKHLDNCIGNRSKYERFLKGQI